MIKRHPRYRIKIEDESRLTTIFEVILRPRGLVLVVLAGAAGFVVLGALLVMVTPLRSLLPGYLKQSERSATEVGILRLDSIATAYEQNQRFFASVMRVLDTDRVPNDTAGLAVSPDKLSADSLMATSSAERAFVDAMKERERFNISVLAPLAADGMIFAPVSPNAVFLAQSRGDTEAEILLPADEPVRSVADGAVLASYYSPADGGYVVIVQHPKGFVSRLSRLGRPLVAAGDQVNSGQVVALPPPPDRRSQRRLRVMMWHNGVPLVPFDYIGNTVPAVKT